MQLYRNLLIIAVIAFANFLFYIHVVSFMATEKAEIEQLKKLLKLKYRDLPKELTARESSAPESQNMELDNVVNSEVAHSGNKLSDPRKNYSFILNNEDACQLEDSDDVFLLVVVFTTHEHFEQRRLIRKSWGSVKVVNDRHVVTMFLLGRVHDHDLQNVVEQENEEYHDIIIGNFDDTYKNLTLKTIQVLKWSIKYCPQAKYVMKTDDDMFVHYTNIVKFLAGKTKKNYAVGCFMKGKPIRNVGSKWYMPKEVYPKDKYPPFLSGTGYVMSGDLVTRMYEVSAEVSYLHLEDVFAGTIWEKLGVKPEGHPQFHNAPVKYSYCAYRKLFTSHTSPNFVHIWREMTLNENTRC